MLKKLSILILIIYASSIQAQITFPAPGAVWHFLQPNGGFGPPYSEYNLTIQHVSDSTILGHSCKGFGPFHNMATSCSGNEKTFFYSGNDSVFFYNSRTMNNWQLLYCFNTPVGQSWRYLINDYSGIDTIKVKVDSIKYNTINANSLKTLYVTYTETYGWVYNSVIYDRIGDTIYLLNYHSYGETIAGPCYEPTLLCYTDSLLGLFQVSSLPCNYSNPADIKEVKSTTLFSLFPNPSTGDIYINLSAQNAGNMLVHITDVNGRQLLNNNYVANAGTNSYTLDLSSLENGVYSIAITDDGGNILKQDKVILAK